MDKIEKIRQEIERLKNNSELAKKEWINEGYNQNAFAEDCRINSFDKLLSFIDTLEEPDKSMEEEIKKEMVKLPYYLPSWYRKKQRRDKENTKNKGEKK